MAELQDSVVGGPEHGKTNDDLGAVGGLLKGAVCGMCGTVAMAIVTVIGIATVGLFQGGPPEEWLFATVAYGFFGIPFGIGIGIAGGGLLGVMLGVTRREKLAPKVGAITPVLVLAILGSFWYSGNPESDVGLGVVGFFVAMMAFYSILGYFTGRAFSSTQPLRFFMAGS